MAPFIEFQYTGFQFVDLQLTEFQFTKVQKVTKLLVWSMLA